MNHELINDNSFIAFPLQIFFTNFRLDRMDENTPEALRLRSNQNSNVFIYMTGHGGDNFLKFRDREEISSQEVADCIAQMHLQGRYRELFFMLDTCQASTLFDHVNSPGVITMASSLRGESSYSVSFNSV